MTVMHLFHSAILAFGHMEEELTTACRAAENALEILSNLRPGFTRNVIPRMNSTVLSVSQPNNEDRQVNNDGRNFSRTNARRRQPQAVLFKLGLRPSFRQLARSEPVGKALVEDQQGQSSFYYCLEISKDRVLSLPYTVH